MDCPGLFPSSMSPRGWLICACPLLRLELSSLQEFVEIRNKSGKIRENWHKLLQMGPSCPFLVVFHLTVDRIGTPSMDPHVPCRIFSPFWPWVSCCFSCCPLDLEGVPLWVPPGWGGGRTGTSNHCYGGWIGLNLPCNEASLGMLLRGGTLTNVLYRLLFRPTFCV